MSNAFIPTPKPRRRRKLVSSNPHDNNYKNTEDDIESEYYQDPHVSFVVKAVSALTAAFRLVQLEQCVGGLEGKLRLANMIKPGAIRVQIRIIHIICLIPKILLFFIVQRQGLYLRMKPFRNFKKIVLKG